MIVFCGGSDTAVRCDIDSTLDVDHINMYPFQWHVQLACKLYNISHLELNDKYNNFASGGAPLEQIEMQLLTKVLPLLTKSKIDYLIITLPFRHRTQLAAEYIIAPWMMESTTNFNKSYNSFKNKLIKCKFDLSKIEELTLFSFYKNTCKFNFTYYNQLNDKFLLKIESILKYIETLGTKIFVLNSDLDENEYLIDSKYYFKFKKIHDYIDINVLKSNAPEYSNHYCLKNNQIITEKLYAEIIKNN
jgi:hypothetical protein